ncbi:TadE/TadG family type IV pilus assembly protein [Pseudoclavibacter helvolus]|uniref:TadE/TadG family type IV pilus assembly protein n=1 Tax=Pseudoclavibacter helvolus TaxID=255205 RepID=UPI0008390A08|nr:TadE family type IV pilus minor pilin [Pseudoclavibacter helvolus]
MMRRVLRWRPASARGSATAEFAIVAPAVVLLLAFCLAGLQGVVVQVRLQDAVADAVRLIARGDDEEVARDNVLALVPSAELEISRPDDLVCARASTSLELGERELPIRVVARACALGGGR